MTIRANPWKFLSIVGVVAVLTCGGCASSPETGSSHVYTGSYFYNFESSSFTPDGKDERWCLSGNMERAELPANGTMGPWGTAHVVVRGRLSPPGHYCNLGASRYVLTVDELIDVTDRRSTHP